MRNWCMNCSHEQSYVGQITDYYYCERCGAKIYPDGSGSCEGTREGRKRERDQIYDYDSRNHANFREDGIRDSGWSV